MQGKGAGEGAGRSSSGLRIIRARYLQEHRILQHAATELQTQQKHARVSLFNTMLAGFLRVLCEKQKQRR